MERRRERERERNENEKRKKKKNETSRAGALLYYREDQAQMVRRRT